MNRHSRILSLAVAILLSLNVFVRADDARAYVPFEGDHATWHDGFARYDFELETQTGEIKPIKKPDNERYNLGNPKQGTRRCVVICPKQPAAGNPWSWRGCYWDHQPQTEVELLRRGFHIAYISADQSLKPDKNWDTWYQFLTERHGLSKKPAFIGMSRGGEYSFTWATTHPDQVSCLYSDNPGSNDEVLRHLDLLAKRDVPVLLVCGTIDPILQKFGLTIETIYHRFNGRVSVILKEGAGHHPHSLNDPKPIADFIEASVKETKPAAPSFVGDNRCTHSFYYGLDETYEKNVRDGYYLIRRGPAFSETYDRWDVALGFAQPIAIYTPHKAAESNPWVYRAGFLSRDAAVDQAMLAKGYTIVVAPMGFNSDGPVMAEWTKLYTYLTDHGFAKQPVMEGAGGAAGAVFAWATENPDKVARIYAENPVFHVDGTKNQPIDHLDVLAKAHVPALFICGSEDSGLTEQSNAAKLKYNAADGQMTIIIREGQGHRLRADENVRPAVDFLTRK